MYILCNRFKIIKIIISIYACSCVLLGFVSIGWTGNGSFSKVCFITRHKPNVQGKDLLDSFIQWYMDGSYIVDLHTELMHLYSNVIIIPVPEFFPGWEEFTDLDSGWLGEILWACVCGDQHDLLHSEVTRHPKKG